MNGFTALLELARAGFTTPSFAIFTDLLTGWVLAPGRRTITGMITVGDPGGRHAHDAYHRLVRDGAWSMTGLWRVLAIHAIGSFAPTGVVPLDCDDTLFHKSGHSVEGAGIFRDAVRSPVRRVVYALGLNLVVVTLRVQPHWGGTPIGVPVNARLHKKEGHHHHDRARRHHDPRTGRLATRPVLPPGRATQTGRRHWQKVDVDERGTTVQRLVYVRDVLWYTVNKRDLLRLVIAATPPGSNPTTSSSPPTLTPPAPRPRPATPAAGPSRSVSATSNSTSAPKTRSPGNAKVPNAPPASACGYTP